MKASLRTLLTGILDYAGLFPPARLPLDQALANYSRYRQGPDEWMLARFVCPAARLHELAPYLGPASGSVAPLAVAALGRGGANADEYLEGLTLDLEAVTAFRQAHGIRVWVDGFETRLPPGAEIALLEETIEQVKPLELTLFLEGSEVGAIARACTTIEGSAGVKLRCGGLEAEAFPSVQQVADVIQACGAADLPLKFTAGLHHPLRRFDATVQATMHGFINVFAACVLDALHGVDEKTLIEILQEEDPARFRWEDEQFTWAGQLSAPTEQIAVVRHRLAISFGSCSFDEPRDDLRALGWL
jgi:hypothetical protein